MHSPGRYEIQDAKDPVQWVQMRSAQNALSALPHVSVVATYDLKATSRNEPDVCHRAALWAAAVVKNRPLRSGPSYKTHRIDGARVIVTFDGVGDGLMVGTWGTGKGVAPAPAAALAGFQLAGNNAQWHDAQAEIQGQAVVVTCDEVPQPKAIRYAWAPRPAKANLYNRAGFPALPFAAP
jgi:sialate O-acetylesterase